MRVTLTYDPSSVIRTGTTSPRIRGRSSQPIVLLHDALGGPRHPSQFPRDIAFFDIGRIVRRRGACPACSNWRMPVPNQLQGAGQMCHTIDLCIGDNRTAVHAVRAPHVARQADRMHAARPDRWRLHSVGSKTQAAVRCQTHFDDGRFQVENGLVGDDVACAGRSRTAGARRP